MIRITQKAFRIALVSAFLLAVFYAVNTFIGEGCETELCCPDCDTLAVTRIIDGDTFESDRGRIRLFGIDTPELGQLCSREATVRLQQLSDNTVRVEPGPRSRDTYGRRLFYVYTESGESIDERLVREGLARAWSQDGQHRDLLVRLERAARQDSTGCLW